eukprot:scaffold41760_cov32-Tisochrysis_lutea.AAC.1
MLLWRVHFSRNLPAAGGVGALNGIILSLASPFPRVSSHVPAFRYYIYPVHVSLSFLYSTTLASALYLVLLRYLNRQLIDTVGTDASLTKEESNILQFTTCQRNAPDEHPDAIACRLRLSLVMMYAPLTLPWDVSIEMGSYLYR